DPTLSSRWSSHRFQLLNRPRRLQPVVCSKYSPRAEIRIELTIAERIESLRFRMRQPITALSFLVTRGDQDTQGLLKGQDWCSTNRNSIPKGEGVSSAPTRSARPHEPTQRLRSGDRGCECQSQYNRDVVVSKQLMLTGEIGCRSELQRVAPHPQSNAWHE